MVGALSALLMSATEVPAGEAAASEVDGITQATPPEQPTQKKKEKDKTSKPKKQKSKKKGKKGKKSCSTQSCCQQTAQSHQ